jgi:hypothetical protein
MLERLVVDHVPLEEGSNTYQLVPRPVAWLRKQLWQMRSTIPAASVELSALLQRLDALIERHGIHPDDMRHPDIESASPWPVAATHVWRALGTSSAASHTR